ncbi:hypothetical protein KCU99_g320, partial [Aureobasidium melanogenum]
LVKSPHNLFVLTIDPGLVCDVVLSTDLFLVKDEHLRVHHTVRTTVKKNRRSLLSRKRHRRCCRELEILDWSNNHSLKLDSICGAQFYDTGGRSALLDCLNPEVPAREVDQNTLSILNAHLIRCQHHELTTERVGVTDIAFQNSNRRRGDLVKSFFATESCIHSCSEFSISQRLLEPIDPSICFGKQLLGNKLFRGRAFHQWIRYDPLRNVHSIDIC